MTPLSNFKLTLGFTDVLESTDHLQYHDPEASPIRYVLRLGMEEKTKLEWQFYHTEFVARWLDKWGETVTGPHCILLSMDPTHIDMNFPGLFELEKPVNYIEPKHFDEFTYADIEYEMIYPWYRSVQQHTSNEVLFNALEEQREPVQYAPMPILSSIQLRTVPAGITEEDPVLQSKYGYPEGWKRGCLPMAKPLQSTETIADTLQRYPRVCRISITPIDRV